VQKTNWRNLTFLFAFALLTVLCISLLLINLPSLPSLGNWPAWNWGWQPGIMPSFMPIVGCLMMLLMCLLPLSVIALVAMGHIKLPRS
jgi:hypothetical protein